MISLKAYNQLETSYKWYSRDMNGKTHCVCHFHDIHRGSRQKTRLVGGKLIFNISNDNDVFYFQKKYWFCHGLRYLAMVLPTPHWNHWKMSKQDYWYWFHWYRYRNISWYKFVSFPSVWRSKPILFSVSTFWHHLVDTILSKIQNTFWPILLA